ncbi:GNAT family N-acetyltransferase [Bifidobacterium saguinibicoloris]|uniref:GNAT family N-acetyltransferase n=1 Tax=Bifidobacterium saguinibicoloris TaxID=2834433 RepID=UPI001C569FFB|nr:GNAT family N-acetyltransferase [Bifidobacterium saguinibicoloris]MBW3081429.1 GNAT family N-acetyltransferase [Bifidobacterium saguinibicoloris]
MAATDTATNGTAITYRPMEWDDLDVIADQFYLTWGVDEPGDPDIARMTSRHFVLHYLEPATRADIAQGTDGTFMGVTLSRVAGRPTLFPEVPAALARVDGELAATEEGAAALARTNAWHRMEERLEDRIGVNDRAPAELELFLVAAAARGHGVGGTLWRRMLAYFASEGVGRYYLHTDSSCDVGFYDHKGLERTAECYAKDHPDEPAGNGEDIFIYEGPVPPESPVPSEGPVPPENPVPQENPVRTEGTVRA